MNYVQAFITNISFPTSLDELYDYARFFNVENVLGCDINCIINENNELDFSNYEYRGNTWTAPKWCKNGDIVFFMHSKTANAKISALKTELISKKEHYENNTFWFLLNALFRAKNLYRIYGGKIFAIGRISGMPLYDKTSSDLHWKSNIYAPINDIFLLENPVDISEFNSEILVSRQSSITPVFGSHFTFLKNIITKKNKFVEEYFLSSLAEPIPLSKVTEENWISVLNKYRRSFFLEIQFRTYYVDKLLKYIGDTKTFYHECACFKLGNPTTFVDNVIKINGRYLPVEVKLSVLSEKNIISQLLQYCNVKKIKLEKDKFVKDKIYENLVLVIDTENVYMYNNQKRKLEMIFELDKIITYDDIELLKKVIIGYVET